MYLNEVIPDLLPMLGKILGEHVRIAWEVEERNHTVFADPGQLQQVVLNLAINAGARDAERRPADDPGRQRDARGSDRVPRFKLAKGEYVC